MMGNVAVDDLASTVWMNIAPPRVEFMVWLALLGKLHTKDMLVKKRIILEECNLCSFCSMHTETCDHLLMHCSVAWQVWSEIANDLGLRQMLQQQSFRRMYEWWISKSRAIHNRWRKKMILVSFFCYYMELMDQEKFDGFSEP
uniref:Reverse transcriptase zinc-binding domain-containing protein n=1 Tax=Opuntia streptacantha TaxID=393608 RepID=A0A7C9DGK8_OPUST